MKKPLATFANWLNDRTGFRVIRHRLLYEPLLPGTGWWFTLGSVLLFGLTIQIVTGTALALYYAPTPDHAYDSVRYIETGVRGGSFLRGLHHWCSSVLVVASLVHMARVVFFGSYRKPREVNWIVGIILLHVILAFGLTGYLLPWDQRAYWATVVTINISKLVPVAGDTIAAVLRGGEDVGALTLTRWYALHVLVLPPVLISLVGVHLYLMRRQGISGPVRVRKGESRPFFPYQAARDLTVAVAVGVVLALLAWKGAPALEPPADPTSSDYVPRPEWYFLGLFQLLKLFPGKLEVIGALVVPGIAITLLALLPWIDRAESRELGHRRWTLAAFVMGLATVIAFTAFGFKDRPSATKGGWNLRELAGASLITSGDRCVRCHAPDKIAAPIEAGRISRPADWLATHIADPEMIAPGLRPPPDTSERDTAAIAAALARMRSGPMPSVDPAAMQIASLLNTHCLGCHMVDGVGGKEGPDLTHAGAKLAADLIARRLNNPVDVDPNAEMPPFGDKLTPQQMQMLASWLAARK